MKDSGVEWIGEIPEHWEMKRLKNYIIDLESGVSVNASESESAMSGEIGVLKTSAVYKYRFDPLENKKVFKNELRRVSCPVKKGAIIISRMNAPNLVGASGYVDRMCPNLYLPDRLWQTVFYKDIAIDSKWLSFFLITRGFRGFIESIATGTSPSMKNISKGGFLSAKLPLPPILEQREIVEFIERGMIKIEIAISSQYAQIEKLKEYKSTLINSAVTGKIRVPGIEEPSEA